MSLANYKAKMFNRMASNPKSKPEQIIEALNIAKGQIVADIGSGGGARAISHCVSLKPWEKKEEFIQSTRIAVFWNS